MGKVQEFFSKWAFTIFLIVVAVTLVFALISCIYTAVANPFVGIVGCVGTVLAIAVVVGWIFKEIKEG